MSPKKRVSRYNRTDTHLTSWGQEWGGEEENKESTLSENKF